MTRSVPLRGEDIARLSAALAGAFTLDELQRLLRTELPGGLSLDLETIVSVGDNTRPAICQDLVLWALKDARVGLPGLLSAALRANPGYPELLSLQADWQGVTFSAPPCPYPGMKPFTRADESRFYGRVQEIDQGVDHLRRHPFLAVIGPSGSGKSSLLAAGIVPAIERLPHFAGRPLVVGSMRPGKRPYDTLAALPALDGSRDGLVHVPPRPASDSGLPDTGTTIPRLLLVVDQYEELFSVSEPDQRTRFEQALLHLAASGDILLTIAVRADFYANLIGAPLWEQISAHRLEIAPLRGNALRDAIALPARDVGVVIDPALVVQLLADAGDEPGVLPFVQETLVMLWRRDRPNPLRIEREVYAGLVSDNSGRSGLQVALEQHADHVYGTILEGDGERAVARRTMLRLVQFGDGRPDTRRSQTVAELRSGDDAVLDPVLRKLTDNRLLTFSDEAQRVDLSHEALIRGWPRLAGWIGERRIAELARRQLEQKAAERQLLRRENENAGLLDMVELARAEQWLGSADAAELRAGAELRQLVADSKAALEAEARDRKTAAERLNRNNRLLAFATGAAVLAALVAVGFLVMVAIAQNKAEASARMASEVAERAEAESAARDSLVRMYRDATYDDLSLVLAHDAVSRTLAYTDPVTSADTALLAAVGGATWRMTLPPAHVRHQGAVNSLAFSPAGDTLASGGADGTVRLWQSRTLAPQALLHGLSAPVNAVVFSPGGDLLAGAGDDGDIRLWDTSTHALKFSLEGGHAGGVNALAFQPGGSLLAAGGDDTAVRLWDAVDGRNIATLEGHTGPVNTVTFSADGDILASAGNDGAVRLWDVKSRTLLRTYGAVENSLTSLDFSPDGHTLAGGSAVGNIWLWEAETGERLATLKGDSSGVRALAFSPNGAILASGGLDDIKLWDAPTGAPLLTLAGNSGDVLSLAFHPDGSSLASAGDDLGLRLWAMPSGRPLPLPELHSEPINAVAFHPSGELLAGGGDGDAVTLWDLHTQTVVRSLAGHGGPVHALAFAPTGDLLAAGDSKGAVFVWATNTGELLYKLQLHRGDVYALSFSPDGTILASGGLDNTILLWDVPTGEPLRALEGHEGAVRSLSFHKSGRIIVSGSGDRSVRLWDVARGRLLRTKIMHENAVSAVAYNPDGQTVASGSWDGTVQLWNLPSDQIDVLEGNGTTVLALAFSPDGRTLAAGRNVSSIGGMGDVQDAVGGGLAANVLKLWDVASGRLLRTLRGHTGSVSAVDFSDDGRYLASGSGDASIRVWDAQTVEQQRMLEGNGAPVQALAFSAAGDGLVIGRLPSAGGAPAFSRGAVAGGASTGPEALSGNLLLWDLPGGALRPLGDGMAGVQAIAFRADNVTLAAGGADGTTTLLDVPSGDILQTLAAEVIPAQVQAGDPDSFPIKAVAFHPNGGLLATGGISNGIELWDVAGGVLLRRLAGHVAPVRALAFHPSGAMLASGSTDASVRLWDTSTGEELPALGMRYIGSIYALAFSPDGRTLAAGGGDGIIRLWDVTEVGRLPRLALPGTIDHINALAFSPDGRTLAGGSWNTTVRLWDVSEAGGAPRLLRTLRGHTLPVNAVAFSPDGHTLASGSDDGSVRLWPVTLDDLLDLAAERVQRPLPLLKPRKP